MLTPFADNIWICSADLKMYGVELGARMTVVDLDGRGTLFVHSPVKLTAALKREIDSRGRVVCVVAPNRWHHLFVGDFKLAYPSAMFYCAPGLEQKRPDFKFDGVIGLEQIYLWNDTLEHKLVEGVPIFNEVVFFHPRTKTLILTDLAIHICESRSFLTKVVFKILGTYGKFGWAWFEKILYIRNRRAFRFSIENILNWEIEKVLLTHGAPLVSDGKRRLREAFLD